MCGRPRMTAGEQAAILKDQLEQRRLNGECHPDDVIDPETGDVFGRIRK
jgi:hypothetical protein